eukprot:CAMPEP_0198121688 /NCGR_PEP_ID=MMETSP1442-20131203/32792_1 /TAXON_ID= /ORGANISM="Craspedostauros australis, Strain CCMP3328" /LENGTH=454 /DNA_ID=CAMNT_0043780539 /DNA_START=41 /DNA_END=1405 /DNA_ORIENTATION=+
MKFLPLAAIASLLPHSWAAEVQDTERQLTVTSDGPELCPNDFSKIHQVGNTPVTAPPIEIIEQNGSTVKFKISQIWTPQVAHEVIVQYQTGNMGEKKCEAFDDVPGGDELTFTATCGVTDPVTVVDIFIVDQEVDGDAHIPACCHSATTIDTVRYTYGIQCTPTCPEPEGDPDCPEVKLDFNSFPEYSYVYDDYWYDLGVKITGESKSSSSSKRHTPLPKKEFPIGSAWEDRYGFTENRKDRRSDDEWDTSLHNQAGGAVRVFNTNKPNRAGGNPKCDPNDDNDGDPDLGSPNQACPSGTPGKKSSGPGQGTGGESGQWKNCPSTLLGNVLVIQEGAKSCPDDSSEGGWITFDFNPAIAGEIQFTFAKVLDTDESNTPKIKVWKTGEDVNSNPSTNVYTTPKTGNNGLWQKSFKNDGTWKNRYKNLQRIQFEYHGSGSVAEISYKPSKCPPTAR